MSDKKNWNETAVLSDDERDEIILREILIEWGMAEETVRQVTTECCASMTNRSDYREEDKAA